MSSASSVYPECKQRVLRDCKGNGFVFCKRSYNLVTKRRIQEQKRLRTLLSNQRLFRTKLRPDSTDIVVQMINANGALGLFSSIKLSTPFRLDDGTNRDRKKSCRCLIKNTVAVSNVSSPVSVLFPYLSTSYDSSDCIPQKDPNKLLSTILQQYLEVVASNLANR